MTTAARPVPPGYELADEVGRGGMGVVYRARDVNLDREVAVKILAHAYAPDSPTAARFVEEAKITGRLQHPGIPAVYHVGTLPGGRPFLAMKLIKGDTLAARLKSGGPIDTLSVFEAIAQAVGYAHAHGVIHRDLKPANIMVGAFGEVQVMDWGLAKVLPASGGRQSAVKPATTTRTTPITDDATATATADAATPDAATATAAAIAKAFSTAETADPDATPLHAAADSPFTRAGTVMGTPAFMPPEQAAGALHAVNTRSDVFGLGAVLCVLLTGHPPFDGTDAEGVRLDAVCGRTGPAFARLDACGADPDVIALCKRCLAFAPADRPATADEVATAVATLRRAAEARVKQAEGDKLAAKVRAAEQAKRRRAAQWAAGAVAAVLLLGVAGTTAGLFRANIAREAAEAARADAETAGRATEAKRREAVAAREAEEKQKILAQKSEAATNLTVEFFEDHVLAAARPRGYPKGLGKAVTLRDAITAGLPALAAGFPGQPVVEGRLRMSLGTTLQYLGSLDEAARQEERAVALLGDSFGPTADQTLAAQGNLAVTYDMLGRHPEALKLRAAALAATEREFPPDHPKVLKRKNNLANSYDAVGRRPEALALREKTLAAMTRVLPPDHSDTLRAMNNLAASYQQADRNRDAAKLLEDVLAAHTRVNPPDDPDTLLAMVNLAKVYADLRRPADALKLTETALAARLRVFPPDHPGTLAVMTELASQHAAAGRHSKAIEIGVAALAAQKRVFPPDHADTLRTMNILGASYAATRDRTKAVEMHEAVLAGYRRTLPPDDQDTARGMANLAVCYSAAGRQEDALKLQAEAAAVYKRILPADHVNALTCIQAMAVSHFKLGHYPDARRLGEEALAGCRRTRPPAHPLTLRCLWGVAESYDREKRTAEAIPFIDECVAGAAGKSVEPDMVPGLILIRMRHFSRAGDAPGCRGTAELWEKYGRRDFEGRYDAACYRAIAADRYAKANQPAEAAADADRAMAWLTKAVAAGFVDHANMAADTDLAFLRGRADFQKLLASITPRPVAPAPRRG